MSALKGEAPRKPLLPHYGQAVIYKSGIADHERCFTLDKHHKIKPGRVFPVCGNTWHMLYNRRFQAHFDFIGNPNDKPSDDCIGISASSRSVAARCHLMSAPRILHRPVAEQVD